MYLLGEVLYFFCSTEHPATFYTQIAHLAVFLESFLNRKSGLLSTHHLGLCVMLFEH